MRMVTARWSHIVLVANARVYVSRRSPGVRRDDGEYLLHRHHRDLRPQRLPARGLLRIVGGRKIRPVIGPHDHAGDIVETTRRMDLITILRTADSEPRVLGQEAVDAVSRTSQWRVGQAVFFAIPGGRAPDCALRQRR